ncbi:hypothetical protein WN51_01897 [Melipona quadrifasciata]|uniref:PITH domain-containing protein n=1 Tax=Melipona quadrifasciata TaxID=166423 RepID=A0A0M8ZX31_9HYME|nr:hypothetical protein WN51_01897 [Melipona quadrifasciata]
MAHQCSCGDIHNDVELGIQYNLYQKIDTGNVECLNEYEEGSGVTVFRSWESRLDRDKFVESDVDDELLFNIPFTANIKLKGLIIIGGENNLHPNKVKLIVKFSSVHHLSLHFTGIDRTERIKIYYIGLKGEWLPAHHHGVTICTYELHPQMSDQPKKNIEDVNRTIS